ncbi:MAG: hypothetical protein KC635_27595 [Myxococcales bacterium]|nr:hypothetical protein [Myxococcales bacterium]
MSASLALSSAACDGHGRLSFPTFEELKTAIVGEPEVEMMVGELEALPPEPTPSAPDASGAGGDGGATAE